MRFLALMTALAATACSPSPEENEALPSSQSGETSMADEAPGDDELLGTDSDAAKMTAASPDQPGSVCKDGEEKVFSCTMKSGKRASVCVTGDGDAKFAQYRFGPAAGPAELVWPASADAGKLAFKSVPYSGGGEAQISFTRGDTTYVVFSRVIRTNFTAGEPNNPAISDGILVVRGGSILGELGCAGTVEMPVNYDLAEKYGSPAAEIIYAE